MLLRFQKSSDFNHLGDVGWHIGATRCLRTIHTFLSLNKCHIIEGVSGVVDRYLLAISRFLSVAFSVVVCCLVWTVTVVDAFACLLFSEAVWQRWETRLETSVPRCTSNNTHGWSYTFCFVDYVASEVGFLALFVGCLWWRIFKIIVGEFSQRFWKGLYCDEKQSVLCGFIWMLRWGKC